MMDILTSRYRIPLIVLPIALYIVPLIIHTFLSVSPFQYIGIGLLSLITFPVGILMSFLVLGVQAKNPFFGKDKFGSITKTFFYFFYFGSLLGLFVSSFRHAPDELPINFLPGAMGIAYGCYVIRKKYVIKENGINISKTHITTC